MISSFQNGLYNHIRDKETRIFVQKPTFCISHEYTLSVALKSPYQHFLNEKIETLASCGLLKSHPSLVLQDWDKTSSVLIHEYRVFPLYSWNDRVLLLFTVLILEICMYLEMTYGLILLPNNFCMQLNPKQLEGLGNMF